MAKFQINILGCGSATPSSRHNPACQVIDFRDRLFMIDCGEGAQQTMRRMKLSFSRLTHIFISHLHGDHCFGLPGLLSTLSLHDKGGEVVVHLPEEGLELMRSFIGYFCRDMSYEIRFEPIPAQGGVIYDDHAITIEAFPLYHRVPCTGFIFREKPKLRHLRGDMIRHFNIPIADLHAIKQGADWIDLEGNTIANSRLTTDAEPAMSYAYCSDTMFNERVAQAVEGVDTIYHEATYDNSLLDQAIQRGHSTASQAAEIAARAGANRLIIGHYSQRYTDVEILVDEAREKFPNVIAANEGLKIDLL